MVLSALAIPQKAFSTALRSLCVEITRCQGPDPAIYGLCTHIGCHTISASVRAKSRCHCFTVKLHIANVCPLVAEFRIVVTHQADIGLNGDDCFAGACPCPRP